MWVLVFVALSVSTMRVESYQYLDRFLNEEACLAMKNEAAPKLEKLALEHNVVLFHRCVQL